MSIDLTTALNKATPGTARGELGTRLADLSEQFNLLRAAVEATHLKNAFLLTAPVLAIKAGSSPTVKSTGALSAMAAGVVQSKNANTDMAALVGTLATLKYAAWAFYIDSAGTLSTATKTADQETAVAAVAALPAVPANKVQLGYIVVYNGTAGDFTAGTTALDAADVTTTYVNATAAAALTAAAVREL